MKEKVITIVERDEWENFIGFIDKYSDIRYYGCEKFNYFNFNPFKNNDKQKVLVFFNKGKLDYTDYIGIEGKIISNREFINYCIDNYKKFKMSDISLQLFKIKQEKIESYNEILLFNIYENLNSKYYLKQYRILYDGEFYYLFCKNYLQDYYLLVHTHTYLKNLLYEGFDFIDNYSISELIVDVYIKKNNIKVFEYLKEESHYCDE